MSRTPVRDALTRLATDGLVRLIPARGYFVNDLSRNRVHDVYEVRYALESLGLRSAFPHYSPAELNTLQALTDDLLRDADSAHPDVFDASLQFHRLLVLPCRNDYLMETLDGVWSHPIQRRISMSYRPTADGVRAIFATHSSIVRCIRDGDLEGAVEVLHRCHSLPDDAPPAFRHGVAAPTSIR